VLAQRHVRSALFGAADGDEDRGLTGKDPVAQFRPGELFEKNGIRRLRRHARRGEQQQAPDEQRDQHGEGHAAFYAIASDRGQIPALEARRSGK